MRRAAVGVVGAARRVAGETDAAALIEHMSNARADDGSPHAAGDQEADHGAKNFAFPSHSR